MSRSSPLDAPKDDAPVVGVFVGGRGERLGGAVKGMLRTRSGETILERLAAVVHEAASDAEIVLVGASSALEGAPWPRLEDEPPGHGPLGGLSALLRHAARRGRSALALASDLPDVTPALVRRLLREAPGAAIHAPKIDGIHQPLFARYAPDAVLPAVDQSLASPRRSLLGVLERVGVAEMMLSEAEASALRDWDAPGDLPADLRDQLRPKPR
jgi:molybdopterin-guanine dinucleotide biosynthesis protein A